MSVLHTFSHFILTTTLWVSIILIFNQGSRRLMCPQWLSRELAEPGTEHNQSDCKPLKHQVPLSPQPFPIWEPRCGAGKIRVPQRPVLKAHPCCPGRPGNRERTCPSFLPSATCSLMTSTGINCHQWQCGRSSSNLDLHLRLVRSKGFLQFVWTNPNLFKKQHLNHAAKWGGFSDLKSSPGTCVPQSPPLKRFFSSKWVQTGNIQITVALCHGVYLNLTFVFHQP